MTTVIAFDIGLTGACAVVDKRSAAVFDLPTRQIDPNATPYTENGRTKNPPRRLDGRELMNQLLQVWRPGMDGLVVHEDVRVRLTTNDDEERNTTRSQSALIGARGAIEAVADILRLRIHVVQPQTWKRGAGLLKKPKGESVRVAQALYPTIAHDVRLVKHHNRADALLMARWGLDHLT